MPQLKQPITSIEMITCEYCIYSMPFQTGISCNRYPGVGYQINPEYSCGDGEWLYYGKWIDSEEKDALHTMDYADVYLRLAELNELPRNPR